MQRKLALLMILSSDPSLSLRGLWVSPSNEETNHTRGSPPSPPCDAQASGTVNSLLALKRPKRPWCPRGIWYSPARSVVSLFAQTESQMAPGQLLDMAISVFNNQDPDETEKEVKIVAVTIGKASDGLKWFKGKSMEDPGKSSCTRPSPSHCYLCQVARVPTTWHQRTVPTPRQWEASPNCHLLRQGLKKPRVAYTYPVCGPSSSLVRNLG